MSYLTAEEFCALLYHAKGKTVHDKVQWLIDGNVFSAYTTRGKAAILQIADQLDHALKETNKPKRP